MKNLYRVDMIGFNVIQKALIAFQNDDQDELFTYYDNRTKLRLRKLNVNLTTTDEQSVFLKDLSHKLLHVINSAFKATNVLINGSKKNGGAGDETTSNSKNGHS
jgi:hypothetical protein